MQAPIILLLWRGSLNPNPPFDFGWQTSFHLTRAHFLLRPEDPHRKFLCRLRISLRTHFGATRMEIQRHSLENRFDQNEFASYIERAVSLGWEPSIQFVKKIPLGGMFYGWVQQRSSQVFRGQRCCRESQNTSDVPLSGVWGVKKEELGFGGIDRGTWGFREDTKRMFEGFSLLRGGLAKKHSFVYKLLVG